MRIAIEDLHLARLTVVHAGGKGYRLADNVYAVPAAHIVEELGPLPG